MSVEHARAFVEKLRSDPELVKKFEAASEDERPKMAQGMGYTFTKDDLRTVAKEGEAELSDEDLEAVAGGASATWVGLGVGAGATAAAGAAAAAATAAA